MKGEKKKKMPQLQGAKLDTQGSGTHCLEETRGERKSEKQKQIWVRRDELSGFCKEIKLIVSERMKD